jgi:cell division protein FtsW (lipid II flippase)
MNLKSISVLTLWLFLAIPFAIIARLGQPIPAWWLVVPIRVRPLIALDALAFYAGKIVWPITLTPDYGRSPDVVLHSGGVSFVCGIALIIAFVVVCKLRWRDWRPCIGGLIWFVAALVPVLGFTTFAFQRLSTVADRYLYLPMFGVALCVAWTLDRYVEQANSKDRKMRGVVLLCVIVLAALDIRTAAQCRYWHDTGTLFHHSIEVIGRTPGTVE